MRSFIFSLLTIAVTSSLSMTASAMSSTKTATQMIKILQNQEIQKLLLRNPALNMVGIKQGMGGLSMNSPDRYELELKSQSQECVVAVDVDAKTNEVVNFFAPNCEIINYNK